jgi:hypothetical protein
MIDKRGMVWLVLSVVWYSSGVRERELMRSAMKEMRFLRNARRGLDLLMRG